VRELVSAAASSKEALTSTAATIERGLAAQAAGGRAEAERIAQAIETSASSSAAASRAEAERVARAIETSASSSADAARAAVAELVAATQAALGRAVSATAEQARLLHATMADDLARLAAQVNGNAEAQSTSALAAATALQQVSAAVLARLGEIGGGVSERLDGAAAALASAATDVREALGTLSPAQGRLTSELEALMREVALLAARTDGQEAPEAILDELSRLAEDVEKLVAVVASSSSLSPAVPPPQDTDEPSAVEEGDA